MPVALDSFTITFLARELDDLLRGHRIASVSVDEEKVLTISFEDKHARPLKFLHAQVFPLLFVPGDDRPPRLRKRPSHLPRFEEPLTGCVITGVEQIDLERVVRIRIEGGGAAFNLYYELTPPTPNLFLTGADDKIAAMLFKAGTRRRARTLGAGKPYTPPPLHDKFDPFEVTRKHLESLNWQEDPQVLSKNIRGVSPFFSIEIAWRAKLCESICDAFHGVLEAYRNSQVTPFVSFLSPRIVKTSPEIGITWYEPTGPWVGLRIPARSLNMAVAVAFQTFITTHSLERRKANALRDLRRKIHRWEKVKRKVEMDKKEGKLASLFRKFGELIIVNLDKMKKGDREARVVDLYSDGAARLVIPLEPHLNPQANAEAYFKKARKSLKRAERADERYETAQDKIRKISPLIVELETLTDFDRLKEIEKMLSDAPTRPGEKKQPLDEKAARLGIKPRRYVISGGWSVLVGRSAKENDILTHRYASPSDIWLHARQAQGSHVILKREKRKTEPSSGALFEAASIAAFYSKARTSKHVPVSYAEKRYIKKIRKGPPGLCSMLREKVIFVEPHIPGRLKPK